MINLESTGISISDRLDNKPKKYGSFDKFSLAVVGACEIDKKSHIFLTRENQHKQ